MNDFSATAALAWGWQTFWKRPLLFIGFALVLGLVSWLVGGDAHPGDPLPIVTALAGIIVAIFLDMGATAFSLKAHDDLDAASLSDLWHPDDFWHYLLASLLTGVVIVFGIILLIVPGIIAAIMLLFAKFLVIDRHRRPIEALKESARITKGKRFELFVLVLLIIAINLIGAMLLGVGLLVSVPVSMLAMAYAYRTLSREPGITATTL